MTLPAHVAFQLLEGDETPSSSEDKKQGNEDSREWAGSMMLPIQEVEKFLSENETLLSFVDSARIFLVYVPEEDQDVQKAPMIRINELESHRKDYADDAALTFEVDIQIDLWTKTIKEAQQIQPIIDELMAKNDFQQYASAFDRDPDIALYRYARRYRATKMIDIQQI
ncbi:hypothetical protein P4T60_15795 [Bacillus atrophaeus]|nr:hypothetical protein [Bacillus atrophaeus]MED1016798.1 hypothetical protein [Bacillus atrophaeus]MED1030397.1 hypothetical protein [Bacillus atrophaeus]MED1118391.1 hypothetical protein [Bacillus atrophaeus]MED1122451.1 hypothetical protein [Bacillus atrophaeus]MED1133002.1 hypothetical protein [Bacillus atrophaeus]